MAGPYGVIDRMERPNPGRENSSRDDKGVIDRVDRPNPGRTMGTMGNLGMRDMNTAKLK